MKHKNENFNIRLGEGVEQEFYDVKEEVSTDRLEQEKVEQAIDDILFSFKTL